ncbi:hypothetical protein F4780DRAFT_82097 [Xylariomycetidae sp. FL0641]|nr:hypothetical protein F4780DRAFT_82097 [Xylariomycetidae sp. FL0641]
MDNFAALPKDLLELQLGQIDLLLAMYAAEGAVHVDESTTHQLQELRDWCDGTSESTPQVTSPVANLVLDLDLRASEDVPTDRHVLQLDIAVPLGSDNRSGNARLSDEPPPAKVRALQPAWMSKAEVFQLNAQIPQSDDVLTCIELVQDLALRQLSRSLEARANAEVQSEDKGSRGPGGAITRVWFYFPSISTRAKRDDLVNNAPSYGLTGFLLAGKPGILCLEGASQRIDEYMRFIKTESWGDIPPQHKKVSERYRETGPDMKPAFNDMQEITGLVGERRGERANRGDMKALESWLTERGLGYAFTTVFM